MLFGEADIKPSIVELHRILQRGSRAVVEVGCSRRQPAQYRSLELADVGALPGDQGTTRVGYLEYLPSQWPRCAPDRKDRQSLDVQRRRAVLPGIGDADVQWCLDRMVPDIGRIVAGAAEAGDARLIERVIQPGNSGNVDLRAVEQLLAAGDRLTALTLWTMTVQLSPIAVEVEYIRAERRSSGVLAQWIVDPDEKLRHLSRKRNRAALRTI